ncbi:MAG: mechanosensitive ion channel family protein [Verrucomicrobiaceae bacterium]
MKSILVLILLFLPLSAQQSPIPEEVGVAELPAESDAGIRARLAEIFRSIDALSNVEVDVVHGVVTLSGKVTSSEASEEAKALAEGLAGVVYVRDLTEGEVEVTARLEPARQKAVEIGRGFLEKLPLIGIAMAVVAVMWWMGSWLGGRRAWLVKTGLNELSAGLVGRVVKLLVIGLGIFMALEILDATAIAAGILGVAGVAGVALGFAFRNIVENYLAGILLSMRNPFSTGDAVQFGDHLGKVVRLTSRDTVLMTYEGNHLRIPNSLIITSALTNFTRNPFRRFDFAVGVSTELDLTAVRRLGMEALNNVHSVLDDPEPYILVEELGDSTVNIRFFGWVDQREHDFNKSKSEAIRLVKERFDEAGVEMPEPIYRVHLRRAGDERKNRSVPKVASTGQDAPGMDTRIDNTIEKQVASIASNESETNLLEGK